MADSATNQFMVMGVVKDPAYQRADMGERFLHAYLNECLRGQNKEWYTTMQHEFMQHHTNWSTLFDSVLEARYAHGSKAKKANVLGDWLALSQMQGSPLSFNRLVQRKNRDPRQSLIAVEPKDTIIITVGGTKDERYKDVFDLLYTKYSQEHNGWQALLRRMSLKSMTANMWDTYVDLYPQNTELPLKSINENRYEWETILSRFTSARHALELNRVLVKAMQNGQADELYNVFNEHDIPVNSNAPLYNQYISEALYEALSTNAGIRTKLCTQHLVHVLNTDPTRINTEFDYVVSEHSSDIFGSALFTSRYFTQFKPETRSHVLTMLGKRAQRYSILIETILCQNDIIFNPSEMLLLLQTPYAKALFVESIFNGNAMPFVVNVANASQEISAALLAADLTAPQAFESLLMEHLTSQVSHAKAKELFLIAESLGASQDMTRQMLQTAFEGASVSNSLPIEGLLENMSV